MVCIRFIPHKAVSRHTETRSAKHGALPSCWAFLFLHSTNPFLKVMEMSQGNEKHAGWMQLRTSISCWGRLKLAHSLGQVRGGSGLVGFRSRSGWPQQLYTQDKDLDKNSKTSSGSNVEVTHTYSPGAHKQGVQREYRSRDFYLTFLLKDFSSSYLTR